MILQRIKPHLPWITLLILIGFVGMVDPNFLRPTNLLSLAGDIVPLFIMALGLTFAIYIGSIDLSVQSMANMITVIASVYLASMGAWVAVLCIAVGFCLGLLSALSFQPWRWEVSVSLWRNFYLAIGRSIWMLSSAMPCLAG